MSRRDASTTKVFIGSLPETVTTDDLRSLFEPYGKIVECDIANRCGFLHLEDKDLALKAIEDLNNTNFMGSKISVEKGRIKPPRRNREAVRGGRERGGPYGRNDAYSRGPPRIPMGGAYGGGRDYSGYGDRYAYDRGMPMRHYPPEYGMGERRPMYDDRRGYMDDQRGYGPMNGYERRPYDDRMGYDDRGYDDRRLPPPMHHGYDDRRPPLMADRRPLMDPNGANRGPMGTYDRGPVPNEMYSRRSDYGPKPPLPPPPADVYGCSDPAVGYDTSGVATTGYTPVHDSSYANTTVGGYNTTDASYAVNGAYGSSTYDSRNQTGAYSNMTSGTAAYGTTTSAYGAPAAGYGSGSAPSYNMGTGGYGDTYNTARASSTYEAVYSVPPQPRR
ncbi:hypothetical protein FQA39_LY07240 [Lamprigera yunnana]|nr:hypothetical protein FQA39_LY07240 [Lamprigera yunnana]